MITDDVTPTARDILVWLYEQAEEMRGMYVGHPDPEVLQAYDNNLREAKQLINKLYPTIMETIKLRLFEVEKRDKAILFSKVPDSNRGMNTVWLPRSQIEHITRRPDPNGGKWPECEVTIPEWLAEEKGLI